MKEKTHFTPEQLRQIAVMAAFNNTQDKIAEELGVSRFVIRRALQDEGVKAIVQGLQDNIIQSYAAEAKLKVSELLTKAVQVLSQELDKGNLQAAIQAFKIVGVEAKEQFSDGVQSLTVVLPGAAPKEKEVISEDVTERYQSDKEPGKLPPESLS